MLRLLTMILMSMPMVLDLGQVKCSEGTVFATVEYVNDTDSPVSIHFVRSSCSCVKASWNRSAIAPGASVDIQVGFNPSGLEGNVVRRLALIGEGEKPLGHIEVRANVVNDIVNDGYPVLDGLATLSMKSVRFGYVPVGTAKDMVIHLTNNSSEPICVDSVLSQGFTVIKPEVIPAGEDAQLTVLCAPTAVGSMSGAVSLCLSNRTYDLPVSALSIGSIKDGEPLPALRVKASPVKMARCLARKGWHARLEICNDGSSPLTIYKIEVPESVSIDCHDAVITEQGKYDVKVFSTVPSFTMRIFTDDPRRPWRELSFSE